MQTKATVVAVDGRFATIETTRISACDGCHKKEEGGCSVCSLMGASKKTIRARAANEIGAQVGDHVIVESSSGRMLWYAALVFLLPVLVTIGAWLLAAAFTDLLGWQIAAAGVAFGLTFVGIAIYSKMIERKKCDASIVEIIGERNDVSENSR